MGLLYYTYLKYIAFAIVMASIPVIAMIILKIIQKLTVGRCKSLACLVGKTAIVTGGCAGIGYETALVLASRGCRVIIADKDDGEKAKKKIIEKTNNPNIVIKKVDLTSLQSIRDFAKDINETEERLDILINNAGVGNIGNKHTDDGLHATMQINHFGPFLLTHLLVDLLKKSAPSRIIFVSSILAFINTLTMDNLNHPAGHSLSVRHIYKIYSNSKVCNVITANGFAKRLRRFGVTVNSLHPGIVDTAIYKKSADISGNRLLYLLNNFAYIKVFGLTPEEGAQTTLHLAVSNRMREVTGKYFSNCKEFWIQPAKAKNRKFCDEVWAKSEEYVKLRPKEKIPVE